MTSPSVHVPTAAARSPSSDQTAATLVVGRERLECHLVEISISGFGVMVPRVTAWTGQPKAKLLTPGGSYSVRVLEQKPHPDGCRLTLKRNDEDGSDEELRGAQRWIVLASRACAIGLMAALMYCYLAVPRGNPNASAKSVSLSDVVSYWTTSWSAWPGPDAARVEAEAGPSSQATASSGLANSPEQGEALSLPAISVSLATQNVRQVSPAAPLTAREHQTQLRSYLLAARTGRMRPANSATLPWLFPSREPGVANGLHYRMSEAAAGDLKTFETGLKALPFTSAGDAVQSLRGALSAATTVAATSASPVEGLADVKRILSADAAVYFRLVDGEVEILRVLPVEIDEPARSRTAGPDLPFRSASR